jgi:hypothetical protein
MLREPLWFGFCVSIVASAVSCYLHIWSSAILLAFVCGAYFARLAKL